MGWLCVVGSTLVLFCSFGYANAFGVFQSYYQLTAYPNKSASDISWIGSLQLFLQVCGTLSSTSPLEPDRHP